MRGSDQPANAAATRRRLLAEQNRRLYRRHVEAAVISGNATQEEVDGRWEFKRRMKDEGKDVEHFHLSEDLLAVMQDSGFAEVGVVWRWFATTTIIAF